MSSRLIVRGLPSYLTDARLREHFSKKGAVTDVKLMRRPDGTSRKFGFVGYRSEAEAQDALEYFDKTFIDTSRISIELARKIGDEELEERKNKRKASQLKGSGVAAVEDPEDGNRKRSKKSGDENQLAKKQNKKDKGGKGGAISFEEFMSVMKPKSKRKAWQNEDTLPEQSLEDITAPVEKLEKKAAKKAAKDASNAQQKAAESSILASGGEEMEEEEDPTQDAAANDTGLTDEEYMRLRMKHKVGTELEEDQVQDKEFEQSDDEAGDATDSAISDEELDEQDEEYEHKQQQLRLKAEEAAQKEQEVVDQIMETGRLFVRNLPFAATAEELEVFFSNYGSVSQVHIPIDKQTKASKGLAFVTFSDPAHALAAYRAKDGSTFQGRLLHLIPAVNKEPAGGSTKDTEKKATLKQQRLEAKKQDAGKDFNWSSLYMSSDAVASSIAERLGVSKSDILNPSADGGTDNAAVRLALAETRIIQETKEFFTNEGINVEAFAAAGGKQSRSDTTILVKNIPFGTAVEEIQNLFQEFGEVDKVLIPPSGTIALVEMPVVSEAKVAFRSIAYKRFKGGILYLEKAPVGIFNESATASSGKQIKQAPIQGKTINEDPTGKGTSTLASGTVDGEEEDVVDGATLYIKNLSFSTTDSKLCSVFGGLTDFVFGRVQTKPDPKRPNDAHARLSMGYGFVGFRSVASAQTAQRMMNGKVVDGHTLVVTFARRNAESSSIKSSSQTASGGGGGTKLLVKNLAFEVTKKELRELFSSQGTVKSVRLPKKYDNTSRGFGFVEYSTAREARNAMEVLKHTHLLGRHLVIQWPESSSSGSSNGGGGVGSALREDPSVEQQRKKTKSSYVDSNSNSNSSTKKDKLKLSHQDILSAVQKEKRNRVDVEDDDEDE